MRQRLLLPLVLLAATPAHGEQATPPPSSAYQEVMQAQYAAKGAPLAVRPEEAQRIYDSYLHSLGQPGGEQSRDNSTASTGNMGVTAH